MKMTMHEQYAFYSLYAYPMPTTKYSLIEKCELGICFHGVGLTFIG